MKKYLKGDEWNIIEEGFHAEFNKVSESIFSLGNGRFGQRGNFEEYYSGESLQGNYVAGVYYPDKTKVGWWKNGYPEYFAKVLNAVNWIEIDSWIDGERLNLADCKILMFKRILHMREGYLERRVIVELPSGKQVEIHAQRFCSMANNRMGVIQYSITPLNFDGDIEFHLGLDGDVRNADANYEEHFWEEVEQREDDGSQFLTMRTKKTGFEVCVGFYYSAHLDGQQLEGGQQAINRDQYVGYKQKVEVQTNEKLTIYKYVSLISSMDIAKTCLLNESKVNISTMKKRSYVDLLQEHQDAWKKKWNESDLIIKGDVSAQQAIRFNIFHLNQTYTGEDERLNIGPKGFTGEKYGGATHWDTEAYCIPYYLRTAEARVAKNLLLYRYRHLEKAIENGEKLGFSDGAALYPMVTMNGEECHNEWEITFEEIHRNGSVAYAIYNYVTYTGDRRYLADYGIDVLIAIARFWSQRVNWSEEKQAYVILGVTGPNEYENNVNNNWYTNTIAVWCLNFTIDVLREIEVSWNEDYQDVLTRTNFKADKEIDRWKSIIRQMYFPEDKVLGVFLQQDGFLDKEQVLVKDLDPKHRPLNQKWSWDRILRSVFIKQADVLQGLYFFEEKFDLETLRRNFDFYESRTVHESSLSPCVHAVLAAKLNRGEQAYELYLRTARLDLDDYNNDTEDGLHITSMAGSWMSVVEGFAGMRVRNDLLSFSPIVPKQWECYSFMMNFRGIVLQIEISENSVQVSNKSADADLLIGLFDDTYTVRASCKIEIPNKKSGNEEKIAY
ncbi:family 65 glycosyl hydrolase domain-containing protein [Albibacterium indicum]|uniref:family 65 glycosyl hydrolase domain-containing protein n=1 Tax=Albibacterium indicum TaxID=2292082 RepID=UPI000E4CA45F|nr:family 65 glycosyl hydrolase domain-containing protein [Pedobacter indicus]